MRFACGYLRMPSLSKRIYASCSTIASRKCVSNGLVVTAIDITYRLWSAQFGAANHIRVQTFEADWKCLTWLPTNFAQFSCPFRFSVFALHADKCVAKYKKKRRQMLPVKDHHHSGAVCHTSFFPSAFLFPAYNTLISIVLIEYYYYCCITVTWLALFSLWVAATTS